MVAPSKIPGFIPSLRCKGWLYLGFRSCEHVCLLLYGWPGVIMTVGVDASMVVDATASWPK